MGVSRNTDAPHDHNVAEPITTIRRIYTIEIERQNHNRLFGNQQRAKVTSITQPGSIVIVQDSISASRQDAIDLSSNG